MRLTQALIAKSLADTILVATLGIVFYWSAFPPTFQGWGEVSSSGISGWAVDQSAPASRVELQLFIDGKFAGVATANQSRPDVVRQGWSSDEWHGYSFSITAQRPGTHEARVYALHASSRDRRQSLQLVGDPIKLLVDDAGTISKAEAGTR